MKWFPGKQARATPHGYAEYDFLDEPVRPRAVVPGPVTWMLMLTGVLGFGFVLWRSRDEVG